MSLFIISFLQIGFEFLTHVPYLKENLFSNEEENHDNFNLNKEKTISQINTPPAEEIANPAKILNKNRKIKNFLCITAKLNSLKKFGKPKNKEEHLHRVLTRENTPCAKYIFCPQFKQKKEKNLNEIDAYFVYNFLSFYSKK